MSYHILNITIKFWPSLSLKARVWCPSFWIWTDLVAYSINRMQEKMYSCISESIIGSLTDSTQICWNVYSRRSHSLCKNSNYLLRLLSYLKKFIDRKRTSPSFSNLCGPVQAPDLWMKTPFLLEYQYLKMWLKDKLNQNQGPRHMTPVKLSNISALSHATMSEAQSWRSRDEPFPVFFIFILSSQSPDYNNMDSIVCATEFWSSLLHFSRYLAHMSWSFLTVLKPWNSFYPYSGRMKSLAYFHSPFESKNLFRSFLGLSHEKKTLDYKTRIEEQLNLVKYTPFFIS